MTCTVIYAVCTRCAHVEARPGWAENDWQDCEVCRAVPAWVEGRYSLAEAEDLSEEILENLR